MSEEKKADPLAINISSSVIEEALKSVERRTQKSDDPKPDAVAAPPAAPAAPALVPSPAPAAEKAAVAPAAAPASSAALDTAQQEIKKLKLDVLEARQTLRQREAELEASQGMSRETLNKLKDQHERTLRAIADLDNHKKRVVREREETAKFGQEKVLREFVTVLDNLDRALEHAKSPADFEGLRSGVAMIRKHFEDMLAKFGVKGFSAKGKMFDPKFHEAIQQMESDEPPGTVVHEVVRGFTLHDRLMRPAMVAVAKPRAAESAAAAPAPAASQPEANAQGEASKAEDHPSPEAGAAPAAEGKPE